KKDAKKEEKKDDRPGLKSETPDVELTFGAADKDLAAIRRRTGKDLKETDVVKVPEDLLKLARQDALAYLEKKLPEFYPSVEREKVVTKITLVFDGKTTELERKKTGDLSAGWVFRKPTEMDGRQANNDLVNFLISTLNSMGITRWESLEAKPEQLGPCGLKDPPATGKVMLTLKGEKAPKEVSLLVGSLTDDKNGYFARKSDFERVFVIAKNDVDKFKKPLLDLTVLDFDEKSVKSVKLIGWPRLGKPLELELERKSSSDWEGKGLPAGVKVNAGKAELLLQSMRSLQAEKFV